MMFLRTEILKEKKIICKRLTIYEIDFRPHFEILGEKYKNNDPGSEEEVWIPVRPRA